VKKLPFRHRSNGTTDRLQFSLLAAAFALRLWVIAAGIDQQQFATRLAAPQCAIVRNQILQPKKSSRLQFDLNRVLIRGSKQVLNSDSYFFSNHEYHEYHEKKSSLRSVFNDQLVLKAATKKSTHALFALVFIRVIRVIRGSKRTLKALFFIQVGCSER